MTKNKKNEKEEEQKIKELKRLVWTLLEKINDMEAEKAANKKGV